MPTVEFDILLEVTPPGHYLMRDVRVPDEQEVPARRRNDENVPILLELRILGVEGPVHIKEVQVFPLAQAERQPLDYRPVEHHCQQVEHARIVHRLYDHGQAGAPRDPHISDEAGSIKESEDANTDGSCNKDSHYLAQRENGWASSTGRTYVEQEVIEIEREEGSDRRRK